MIYGYWKMKIAKKLFFQYSILKQKIWLHPMRHPLVFTRPEDGLMPFLNCNFSMTSRKVPEKMQPLELKYHKEVFHKEQFSQKTLQQCTILFLNDSTQCIKNSTLVKTLLWVVV